MSPRSIVLPALLALMTSLEAVGADSAVRDVGDGLAYARVTRAPADLPSTETLAGRVTILDLRFTSDDGTADAPLNALIRATAGVKRPVFLLFNAETSDRLRRVIKTLDSLPGVITVAPSNSQVTADFQVVVTREEERRAYQAFTAGKSVIELTTDLPDKRRNDEASLTQHPPTGEPGLDDPADEATPPAEKATVKSPKPVIDAALQRAIHLYRGLRALKAL